MPLDMIANSNSILSTLDAEQGVDVWAKENDLDWEVKRSPLMYRGQKGRLVSTDERQVLYRSDTGAFLSSVSPRYQVVQPTEVLQTYRDLLSHEGFQPATLGALGGGRKIWMLAKTPYNFALPDADEVLTYVLLATSYDNSLATHLKFTSVRVICENTLAMAIGEDMPGVRVKHFSLFDRSAALQQLAQAGQVNAAFAQVAQRLAQVKLDREEQECFVRMVLGIEPEKEVTGHMKTYHAVMNAISYSPGANLASANDTVWGALNGITYVLDHERKERKPGARLGGALLGDQAQIKARALDFAMQLAA
jgi:phage/plasmid-like protein (TIGR03299 family)